MLTSIHSGDFKIAVEVGAVFYGWVCTVEGNVEWNEGNGVLKSPFVVGNFVRRSVHVPRLIY
jgi:hypothetical protein